MNFTLLPLIALAIVPLVQAYKILCVFPVPTPSHNILGKGIVNALLNADHQVWWATPYPEKVTTRTNLTVLDVSATKAVFKNVNMSDAATHLDLQKGTDIAVIAASSSDVVEAMVEQDFDAVVTEWFVSDLPAGYAAVQQVPWIMLSSIVFHPILENLVDDVTSTPLIPTLLNRATIPMDFWQRVANSVIVGAMKIGTWILRMHSSTQYEELFGRMAASRGVALPPLSATYSDVSVLLVNSHPAVAAAQSRPPNVVDVAGYHVEGGELSQELQQLLDSSTQGFIYFSLGSVVQMSQLTSALKKDLSAVFGSLPYTVLWRSDEDLEGLPSNVHARKWFPQTGVLAHKNIKLFITHGGLLSIIEAVHFGVPILAVPVFGDQPANVDRAVDSGYARRLDFHGGMGQDMQRGIEEMTSNDSYYAAAKRVSRLFHHRPVPPAKLITHYVELAIESKGAHHLRSAARHYAWYQRARIDQLIALVALSYGLYVSARAAARAIRGTIKRKKD